MARIRRGTCPKGLTSAKEIIISPGGAAPPTIGQTKLNNLTYNLTQWFLTCVRSNARDSVNQFQGFAGLVHPARLCTNTVYSYIHVLNLKKKKLQLRSVR